MTLETTERAWVPLTARERRVLGVMVEKQKTTPEAYPMSIAAIATGCNQKSNRDPITNYDTDDVEEILQGLRKKGAAVMIEGSGRVAKWKHSLYDWFGLRNKPVEMAVLAELMLRGRQTEGDLRSRASRMEAIPDLESLQAVLKALQDLELVVYLTPPEQKRGAVVTHRLYPPAEFEHIRQEFSRLAPAYDDEPKPARAERSFAAEPVPSSEIATLRTEIEGLRARIDALTDELRDLKSSLGA
ncbi:MAG: hypothetical protein JWN86_2441 [Planctomycetota bacterium]|nr:hypothetical protein [Planctomycetota bacterium]